MSVCRSVSLFVSLQNFVGTVCISKINGQKLMKLNIQLHLDIIWFWLHFGVYRSRSSDWFLYWFLYWFLISLTRWNRTKLRAIIPNTNYFKPIILRFKIFVYNRNSKTMYNFCICRGNISLVGGSKPPPGVDIFYRCYFQKESLKIRKTESFPISVII